MSTQGGYLSDETAELKSLAEERGAEAVGVADVDDCDARAPEGHRIRDLFPAAESVVVIGMQSTTEGAKATKSSTILQDSKLNRFARRAQIRTAVSDAIEMTYDYRALRFPQLANRGGEMNPYASIKVCAEEAGLGRRGINDLVLHPDHGAHLVFTGVITDMPLEPDGRMEDNPCPTEFCVNAYENAGITPCIAACPVDALDGDIDDEGEIENRTFDRTACMSCAMNNGPQRFSKQLERIIAEDDPEQRKMMLHGTEFQKTVNSLHRGNGFASCFECQHVCPVGHESAQRVIADGGVDADNPTVEDVAAVREAVLADESDGRNSPAGRGCDCEDCSCQ